MKNSFLIKALAAVAILMYVASFIGINVHSCSCTGNVCVSLAMHQHHEHDGGDDHHHHGHACQHCNSEEHQAHNCCHNQTFRLAISGDSDHSSASHIQAPAMDFTAIITPYTAPLAMQHNNGGKVFMPQSPHPRDIIKSVCILRV